MSKRTAGNQYEQLICGYNQSLIKTLEMLKAAGGNVTRAHLLIYLRQNEGNITFTDLMARTPAGFLNTASVKFHLDSLREAELLKKHATILKKQEGEWLT